MEKKTTFVTFETPKNLERQARIAAAHLGVSRSEVCRLGLAAFLKNLELPEKAKEATANGLQVHVH